MIYPQSQSVHLINLVLTKTYYDMNTKGTRFHLWGANDLPKVDVHPRVAVDQMPVVRFSILQLHELGSQNFND